METIKFKGDSATRRRFFVAESFAHPAKMASGLFLECLERYSKPGDVVLDVMAGSGTSLLGAMYGRMMILNELELHFILPMVESWKKIQQNGPALGHEMGQAVILRGDARALPLPDASVGAAITSPPFQDQEPFTDKAFVPPHDKAGFGASSSYTRPVDAIVTSPPFSEARQGTTHPISQTMLENQRPERSYRAEAIGGTENIGNLRNAAYWDAMRLVYQECWRVLKPGGIMALVLKGFTRAGQYVNLPGQTQTMLLEAGWLKHDEWRRQLWSLSFWRILQKRRSPETWDERLGFESVLAFRKPVGVGQGIDTVITSPPWEDKTALQDSQWLHSHEAELAERFRQAHAGEKGLPGNTKPENRTTMDGYTMKDKEAS